MAAEVKTEAGDGDGKTPAAKQNDPIDTETDVAKLRALAKENATKAKDAEAKTHAANEEAKKHRLDGKAAKDEADRLKRGWKIAMGEDPDNVDPAKLEKDKTSKQLRNLYLKSAFVSEAAKDMHDADFSFDAVANEFSDIEVDVATGKVDKAAVKKKVEELKKTRAFLFQQPREESGRTEEKPKPKGHNDGGPPSSGENPWVKWQNLKKTDPEAAQKFYAENRKAIGANMPK